MGKIACPYCRLGAAHADIDLDENLAALHMRLDVGFAVVRVGFTVLCDAKCRLF